MKGITRRLITAVRGRFLRKIQEQSGKNPRQVTIDHALYRLNDPKKRPPTVEKPLGVRSTDELELALEYPALIGAELVEEHREIRGDVIGGLWWVRGGGGGGEAGVKLLGGGRCRLADSCLLGSRPR